LLPQAKREHEDRAGHGHEHGVARRCRAIILQNFYETPAVDSAGIILAACGLLTPLFAAFIHVASELTFILNSTRLLPSASTPVATTPRVFQLGRQYHE
jgi:hypothetical protein